MNNNSCLNLNSIAAGLMNIVLGVICENAIYAASRNVENMQKIVLKHQQMVINSITAARLPYFYLI